jgi:adenosylmethionine---8-amino-7-oxononanoate aminotransferase
VLADFERIIATRKVAAFIVEPLIQGSGGMVMYDSNHLDRLFMLAKQHGIICIADEVMTGFGRTGRVFASDYLNTKPDIFCISKGITGGFMPLGVTSCTQKIYDAFLSDDKLRTFFHGHSYTANPLACAAANAAFELLKTHKTAIQSLVDMQHNHKEQLKNHPNIEQIRQLGTIVAFEVKTNSKSDYFSNIRDFLYRQFIQRGLLLRPLGNTVYIMPPYCISEDQLNKVYTGIKEVLDLLDN